MKNNLFYIRVFAAIAGGYILSGIVLAVFFPARTPILRPNLALYLREKTGSFAVDLPKLIPKIDLTALLTPPTKGTSSSPAVVVPTSGQTSVVLIQGESAIASGARQQLATQRPRTISTGIYITDNSSVFLTIAKQKEIEWTAANFSINGKTVYIRIPTGQSAPPQSFIQAMY